MPVPGVFISHAHGDLKHGMDIRDFLASFGIDAFLAHRDVRPSEKWENRVRQELRTRSVFVALLSRRFRRSPWAVQELGYAALRRSTLVLLVQLDRTKPFGFARPLQGRTIGTPTDLAECILDPILDRFAAEAPGILATGLRVARTPREAEAILERFAARLEAADVLSLRQAVTLASERPDHFGTPRSRELLDRIVRGRRRDLPCGIVRTLRAAWTAEAIREKEATYPSVRPAVARVLTVMEPGRQYRAAEIARVARTTLENARLCLSRAALAGVVARVGGARSGVYVRPGPSLL